MFLWFIGASWVLVALVFQSPALDYRLVMLGSVLPLLDGFTGGASVLHSLLFSVVLLAMVLADEASHSEGILLIAPLENKRSCAFALAQGRFGMTLPNKQSPPFFSAVAFSLTSKG